MPRKIEVFVAIDDKVALGMHGDGEVQLPLSRADEAACMSALAEAMLAITGTRATHLDDDPIDPAPPRPRLQLVKSDG